MSLMTMLVIMAIIGTNVVLLRRINAPTDTALSGGSGLSGGGGGGGGGGDAIGALGALKINAVGALVQQVQSEITTMNTMLNRADSMPAGMASVDAAASQSAQVSHLRGALGVLQAELTNQGGALSDKLHGGETVVSNIQRRLQVLEGQLQQTLAQQPAGSAVPAAPLAAPVQPPPPPPPPPPRSFSHSDPVAVGGSSGARAPLFGAEASGEVAQLGMDTAVLMICYNRPDYLERSLKAIRRYHPGTGHVPIVISQDGDVADVNVVIEGFKKLMEADGVRVIHLRHKQGRDGSDGYFKLAQHYGWALEETFNHLGNHGVVETTRVQVGHASVEQPAATTRTITPNPHNSRQTHNPNEQLSAPQNATPHNTPPLRYRPTSA